MGGLDFVHGVKDRAGIQQCGADDSAGEKRRDANDQDIDYCMFSGRGVSFCGGV